MVLPLTIVLGYALALLMGLSLGLLGGGGSILTVPVLHYVLGYDVKEAVPMSLVVVGLTSGFGAVAHWKAGTVNPRAALGFGPPAIVGALLGAELGLRVAATVQLTVFAVVMLAAAVSMYFGAALWAPEGAMTGEWRAPGGGGRPRVPFITLVGAVVGVLTGFVGVGGGFVYVPALAVLGGLHMKEAVGTSLVLILLSCIAGAIRYRGSLAFDWTAIAVFTAIALVGVAAGSRMLRHVSQQRLRRGFALFLLVMGALVLARPR
ncbi:MAG TPA: sulfite exporter TauE/SafE family protein [Gemmatimonadales bacterium]|jgi:hypothetical protein|nr:sulfite exporter TauE/SafE family protein [Gemmatimonadales bacterium]